MAYDNRLLDTLAPDDLEALRPHLRAMTVSPGQVLIEQDAPIAQVHFPADAQLVNLMRFSDGSAVETAVVGREGVSGLAPFLADVPCGWEVAVRTPGVVHAMPATALRARVWASPKLMAKLLTLSSVYQSQSVQSAACNAAHKALPRLARWLLTAADLTPGERLRFTQEELAALLGAQRTTVNEAAHQLKAMKAIRYARGSIEILDRGALRREACECYDLMRGRMKAAGVLPEAD